MSMFLRALLAATPLLVAGCSGPDNSASRLPTKVAFVTAAVADHTASASLTGVIAARVSGNISFRIAGRVSQRLAEVGQHVSAGDVLARLDPTEQQADVVAAQANVDAANAQLAQVSVTFERQKALLAKNLTSQKQYDEAQESFRVATGTLDAATAGLANAKANMTYADLKATASGVITSRSIEIGQTVQAAQTVYTIAEDGDRDAVFNVPEIIAVNSAVKPAVDLRLVADPSVTAAGKVREVSPVLDAKTGSIRVKVEISDTPAAMSLGAAVVGSIKTKPVKAIVLPWNALSSRNGKPAVWVIDPGTKAVSLADVGIQSYDGSWIVVGSGIKAGQQVVTAGAQLLSPGQVVDAVEMGAK